MLMKEDNLFLCDLFTVKEIHEKCVNDFYLLKMCSFHRECFHVLFETSFFTVQHQKSSFSAKSMFFYSIWKK